MALLKVETVENAIIKCQNHIEKYHQINLPTQLIHGDVHNDNILTVDDKVTAILDFEFIA